MTRIKLDDIHLFASSLSEAVEQDNIEQIYQFMKKVNWTTFSMDDKATLINFAFYYACCFCENKTVIKLLNRGADIGFWDYGAVFEAVAANKLDLVRLFIDKGYPINYANEAHPMGIVGCAAADGHLELLQYLVQMGADTSVWEDAPFRYALANHHLDCAEYLLSVKEQDFFSGNAYAITSITEKDDAQMFAWFMKKTVERNLTWPCGFQIISLICYHHKPNILAHLLDYGWTPDAHAFLKSLEGEQHQLAIEFLAYKDNWIKTIDKDLLIKVLEGKQTSFELAGAIFQEHGMLETFSTENEYFQKCKQYCHLHKKLDQKNIIHKTKI